HRLVACALPRARNVNAEPPRIRRTRLRAPEEAGSFVVRRVESMRIDSRRARLQPDMRRPRRAADRFADGARRRDSRIQNFASIRGVVGAVAAAAGEVDDDVSAVDFSLPRTERRPIPLDDTPRGTLHVAAEHYDVMATAVECTRQYRSDLSRPTRNHDLHGSPACQSMKRFRNSGRGTRQRS